MRLTKIILFLLTIVSVACSDKKPDIEAVIPNIPTSVPQLPESTCLNVDSFPVCIDVEYRGDTAFLSTLPQGVRATVDGARVGISSSLKGVHFTLRGEAGDGSFTLSSSDEVLVSMNALMLFSQHGNAMTITSPKGLFLRAVEGRPCYIMDAVVAEGEYVAKNSAAIRVDGNVVLCGGSIAVKGQRMSAIHCSGRMILNNKNLAIERAFTDAIVADSGIVVAGGNIYVSDARDAFKSKRGNLVVLGGNIKVDAAREKGDGVQVRNFYLYAGNVEIKSSGVAARGINAKQAVYLMDGYLNVETSGEALFSPKKADYTSASCIKSGTHTYIRNACVALVNNGNGGKCVNCDGIMHIDGGTLSVLNRGNDVQHPEERDAHSSAKGVKCDSVLIIRGGAIDVRVFGKGERSEGVESKKNMFIGGNAAINIFAFDDALNAGGDILIDGGRLYAYSVANDGIDGNGRLSLKAGVVVANGSNAPEQGLDVDGDARFDVTGGVLVAVGGTMGPAPTLPRAQSTTQPVAACVGAELTRGKYAALCNDDGTVLYAYRLPRSLMGGAVTFSLPQMEVGNRYSFVLCDSVPGAQALGNGLLEGGRVDVSPLLSWKQEQLLAVVSADGTVRFLDKLAGGDNGGHPMPPPPFGGDNGGHPMPPPPFGGDNGGHPMPPPFGGDNGGQPMPPPFGGDNGGHPMPPSFGGDNGGQPMPPPFNFVDEGYNENNLPANGWIPVKK